MSSSKHSSPSRSPAKNTLHNVPALALAVILLTACSGGQTGGTAPGVQAAPDFTLTDLDGRTVRLSDHRGKVVVINFWATWCVPCAAELPHLQRLYAKYRDQGLEILAISMDGPESVAAVGPQVRQYGLTFPVLLDEETRVVGVYNPKRTAPFTAIVGRDGAVATTREGYSAGDEVALEAELAALLSPQ